MKNQFELIALLREKVMAQKWRRHILAQEDRWVKDESRKAVLPFQSILSLTKPWRVDFARRF
jgi:hypothetical protein